MDKKINVENVSIVKYPAYMLAEHTEIPVKLINLDLNGLVHEKMYILFEKLNKLSKELIVAKQEYVNEKQRLLRETDFEEALGKKRTNKDEREAYIEPLLIGFKNSVSEKEEATQYYKDKLVIIDDLISNNRLLLKIEANLHE